MLTLVLLREDVRLESKLLCLVVANLKSFRGVLVSSFLLGATSLHDGLTVVVNAWDQDDDDHTDEHNIDVGGDKVSYWRDQGGNRGC